MSEKEPKAPKMEPQITLSMSELQQMITQSNERMASILAEALKEAKKPYIDPKQAENDALFRKSTIEIQERIRRQKELSEANCPHMQGSNSLSDFAGQLTSIAWHRLDDGQTLWGICTNCQRQFWPEDADYRLWLAKKSGNRVSAAGQRFGLERIKRPDTARASSVETVITT